MPTQCRFSIFHWTLTASKLHQNAYGTGNKIPSSILDIIHYVTFTNYAISGARTNQESSGQKTNSFFCVRAIQNYRTEVVFEPSLSVYALAFLSFAVSSPTTRPQKKQLRDPLQIALVATNCPKWTVQRILISFWNGEIYFDVTFHDTTTLIFDCSHLFVLH